MSKGNKYIAALILIALFSFIIRFIGIDRVPPGIPTDTLLYFSNARSIAETGRDIYDRAYPLFSSHKGFLLSPVTVYIISLCYKLFGFSHIVGYFPNIFISTLSIIIAAVLATRLTGSKKIGLFTAVILSVSPWHYHLSRTGFEGIFGFTLVLIGIYFSICALEKPKFYFISFLLFLISAFTYKAINIFLIFYPVVFLLTVANSKNSYKKAILFVLSVWMLVILQWFYMFVLYRDTYSKGYINNNIDTASFNAQEEQKMSDAPRPLRIIASNTMYVLAKTYIRNYLHFFSPQYLLSYGDNDKRFSTGGGGQLYLLDFLLIGFGALYLWKKNKKITFYFLLSIIIISPIASLISDEEYAIRTFISVFIFSILGGSGVLYVIDLLRRVRYGKFIFLIVALLYCWSVFQYLYRYHYLYVHYSREAWGGVNKEVMMEAYKRRNDFDRITFGHSSEFEYIEFMYWNALPVIDMQKTLTTYNEQTLTYQNIYFSRDCGPMIQGELLYTERTCYDSVDPVHYYYLPKLLIWKWKSYMIPKLSISN